jgi:hypothetical protein
MELTNDVYTSLTKYFSLLKKTGYKSYKQVEELLVLIFIEELLNGPLSQFISEEDYNSIANSLECLYGSCMIAYPDYKKAISEVLHKAPDYNRVTEDGTLRSLRKGLRILS